jgi:O-acetyl-ADP-ribose deacetylase (regulator of RNase III)
MNVKIFLRDLSEPMVAAWSNAFAGESGVEASCGNIFDLQADAIVSPANSFGFMDGGIDLAYSRYFGRGLQERLQAVIREKYYGELPVGNAAIVKTGSGNIKYLISAPTMRLPQDISETLNAYLAFRAALIEITEFNKSGNDRINSVLCPGLGTLTGALPPEACAVQMREAYDLILKGESSFPRSLGEAFADTEVFYGADAGLTEAVHRLNFAFGTADYYNTDDEEKIYRAIIKAARISEVRNFGKERIAESYADTGRSNYRPKVVSQDQCNANVGLFYFAKDYGDLFANTFPVGTPNSNFGYHKDFFRELTKEGELEGTDYEAYPRGFTFYDDENEVYVIVGGDWLNKKRGEAVCDIFKYPKQRFPWTIFKSPLYTYKNMRK